MAGAAEEIELLLLADVTAALGGQQLQGVCHFLDIGLDQVLGTGPGVGRSLPTVPPRVSPTVHRFRSIKTKVGRICFPLVNSTAL